MIDYSNPGAYKIKKGDTLYELVRDQLPPGTSHKDIMAEVNRVAARNNIQDPNKIIAGADLNLSTSTPEQLQLMEQLKGALNKAVPEQQATPEQLQLFQELTNALNKAVPEPGTPRGVGKKVTSSSVKGNAALMGPPIPEAQPAPPKAQPVPVSDEDLQANEEKLGRTPSWFTRDIKAQEPQKFNPIGDYIDALTAAKEAQAEPYIVEPMDIDEKGNVTEKPWYNKSNMMTRAIGAGGALAAPMLGGIAPGIGGNMLAGGATTGLGAMAFGSTPRDALLQGGAGAAISGVLSGGMKAGGGVLGKISKYLPGQKETLSRQAEQALTDARAAEAYAQVNNTADSRGKAAAAKVRADDLMELAKEEAHSNRPVGQKIAEWEKGVLKKGASKANEWVNKFMGKSLAEPTPQAPTPLAPKVSPKISQPPEGDMGIDPVEGMQESAFKSTPRASSQTMGSARIPDQVLGEEAKVASFGKPALPEELTKGMGPSKTPPMNAEQSAIQAMEEGSITQSLPPGINGLNKKNADQVIKEFLQGARTEQPNSGGAKGFLKDLWSSSSGKPMRTPTEDRETVVKPFEELHKQAMRWKNPSTTVELTPSGNIKFPPPATVSNEQKIAIREHINNKMTGRKRFEALRKYEEIYSPANLKNPKWWK